MVLPSATIEGTMRGVVVGVLLGLMSGIVSAWISYGHILSLVPPTGGWETIISIALALVVGYIVGQLVWVLYVAAFILVFMNDIEFSLGG